MVIQAVFFDMGGTIETFSYDRELRLNAVPGLRGILASAGVCLDLTDAQFLDLFNERYQAYHRQRKQTLRELPTARIWTEFLLPDYPAYHHILPAISEELTVYYENNFYCREMRPETPQVLAALQKAGVKLGVISNTTSLGQVPGNLVRYGIRSYFEPVVLSSRYSWRKPDPAIFHYAARLANVPASRCLYVGDLVSRDVIGARRAGFHMAVQVRHDFTNEEPEGTAAPDAVIESLAELAEIVAKVNSATEISPAGEVKAVLFDAGDILYHRQGAARQFKEYLHQLGVDAANPRTKERHRLADQAYQGLLSQDDYYDGIVRLYGITQPDQIRLGRQILASDADMVQIFAGVPETLLALKNRGFLLGIITDTAASVSTKLRWFEKGGFGRVWDSIIASNEIGVRKPSPGIYQAALQQLGLSPRQAVFVGHLGIELDGARSVGMKTIALNYEKDARADYYIRDFAGLLDVPLIALRQTG